MSDCLFCRVVAGEVPADVVAEPSPRDSMPAIGLAAAIIERRDPDAVIGSFAADHVIRDLEDFWAAVTQAVKDSLTDRLRDLLPG